MSIFRDKTRCYHGGQQHCFEAVFEQRPLDFPFSSFKGSTYAIREILDRMTTPTVYKGHVCRWCGKTVNQ